MTEKAKEPKEPEKTQAVELADVREIGKAAKVKEWELAGLMRYCGWAGGKQVSMKEFNDKLAKFRKRPQGGGRIK